MKKNLRIVSAAAAALLAVAPVAAGAVSTVSADTSNPVNVSNGSVSSKTNIELTLKITNFGAVKAGDDASKLQGVVQSSKGTVNTNSSPIHVYLAGKGTPTADDYVAGRVEGSRKPVDRLEAGKVYVAVIANMSIGLPDGSYTVNGVAKDYNANTKSINGLNVMSSYFTVNNTTQDGAPSVRLTGTNQQVANGEIGLGNGKYSVDSIIDAIRAKYTVETTVTNVGHTTNQAWSDWENLDRDVRAGLKDAGITVNADGTFAKPGAAFVVKAQLHASNGVNVTFPVTVSPDPLTSGDRTFPQIHFGTQVFRGTNNTVDVGDASFNYLPVGQGVNVKGIQDAFTTTVSATTSARITPTVDYSQVNTAVAGKYPVTVSATNSDGKTSSVTFFLTVGDKGATYTTVQADVDEVPVYEISGNTVTDTKTTVKNGDKVATYGTVTVNGKSYTRINAANSTKFVETKYVDGSVKPVPAVAKKVMHNSYIYDKNHKRIGTNVLAAYSTVNVYGPTTKLADGSLVYKIGDNQYVMADNIDGTARVLSHNAYVYKTSKKRADRRVLKKGATVVTYGSPYTFKNGKAYYRIGGPAKQYVKVANFK